MKIAILGWYGMENAGDDRLEWCLRRLLSPHLVIPLSIDRASIPFLKNCDYAVIGGGTMFFKGNPTAQKLLDYLPKAGIRRYSVWGVGIDPCDSDEERALRDLLRKSDAFVVRDQASLRNLSKMNMVSMEKIGIAPDLTWAFPYPVKKTTNDPLIAVNITSGLSPRFGTEIGEVLKERKFEIEGWPFCFARKYRDTDILEVAGIPTPNEYFPTPLFNKRFIVATRFHAMVFAAQSCVPFIPIASSPKQSAFLEELKYPIPAVAPDDRDGFKACLDRLITSEKEIRCHLLEQRAMHLEAALFIHQNLKSTIERSYERRLKVRLGRKIKHNLMHFKLMR